MSDEQVARQVLDVFFQFKVPTGGFLKRNRFMSVRDADFRRGLDCALEYGWLRMDGRDRYRYFLTEVGKAAANSRLLADAPNG